MIWSRIWWAVRPVKSALRDTRINPDDPGPPTVRSCAVAAVAPEEVAAVACCKRKRKDLSSRSGFSGNEGNSERC